MQTVYVKTPLGIAIITGDKNGISSISISDNSTISVIIPPELQQAVQQLNEYFDGLRKDFDLKLQPKGTDFQ